MPEPKRLQLNKNTQAQNHQENLIVQSKISIPFPEGLLINRPRLTSQVEQFFSSARKGILLCTAPVGYGKTLLLSTSSRNSRGKVIWLSAEKDDNTPSQFIDLTAAAICKLDTAFSFGSAAEDLQAAARVLINYLEKRKKPLCWVIDETQHLNHKAIIQFFQNLIDHLPAKLRLVLISRIDLPLRFTNLRVEDALLEIRARELRATREEAAELLQQSGLVFQSAALEKIWKKTEGWLACLKLFILATRQLKADQSKRFLAKFSGTHRFVAEYLFENLIRELPQGVLHFLLTTSIVPFFTLELSAALCCCQDCKQHLALLKNAGLLYTGRYNDKKWYRYHHLLKEFLQMQLPSEEKAALHLAAAAWYQKEKFLDKAGHHRNLAAYLQAGSDLTPGPGRPLLTLEPHEPLTPLTRREEELGRCLQQKLTNKEMAAKLYISEGTVKWHLNNMYTKLGVSNRREALHFLVEHKLLPPINPET